MIQLETNIKEYEKSLMNNLKLSEKQSRNCVKVSVQSLYSRVVSYTPVGDPSLWNWPAPKGYKPGTLKASWELDEKNDQYTIKNQQPYALRVEFGWSTQAPNGMMRRAVVDYPTLLNNTALKFKL